MFRVGMVMMLICYSVIMLANDINVLIASMFTMGLCAVARVNCGYIYAMEFVPQKYHAIVPSAVFVFEAGISIYGSVYFSFISNYWLWMVMIGYLLQVFATISSFFIPESPKFLLKTGRIEEANAVYN